MSLTEVVVITGGLTILGLSVWGLIEVLWFGLLKFGRYAAGVDERHPVILHSCGWGMAVGVVAFVVIGP